MKVNFLVFLIFLIIYYFFLRLISSMEVVPEATVILETKEKVPEVDQVTIENSNKKKSGGAKIDRNKRSKVWTLFEALPASEGAKKKDLGTNIYIVDSTYETGNMLAHMRKCLKTQTPEIG